MENRKCLECYEQLRGRADQKFCSDQCRSTYNNRENCDSHNMMNSINRILKKNYYILANFYTEGKITLPKIELQKKGYRFDYFTCTTINKSSRINYFCYDQGFREQENNKITLVRRSSMKSQTPVNR